MNFVLKLKSCTSVWQLLVFSFCFFFLTCYQAENKVIVSWYSILQTLVTLLLCFCFFFTPFVCQHKVCPNKVVKINSVDPRKYVLTLCLFWTFLIFPHMECCLNLVKKIFFPIKKVFSIYSFYILFRYTYQQEMIETDVLEIVREQLNKRQPMDGSTRNLIRLMTATCGSGEIRLTAAQRLEMWLQNPKVWAALFSSSFFTLVFMYLAF